MLPGSSAVWMAVAATAPSAPCTRTASNRSSGASADILPIILTGAIKHILMSLVEVFAF